MNQPGVDFQSGTFNAWGRVYIHGGCGNDRITVYLAQRHPEGWTVHGGAAYEGAARMPAWSQSNGFRCDDPETLATVVSISASGEPPYNSHRHDESKWVNC